MGLFHGQVGINWGVGSTISSVFGSFQSRDHHIKAQAEDIKDGGETTVSKVYWDSIEESTFSYVAIQNGPNLFGTAPVSFPSIGMFVQVFDSVLYPVIAGFWLVDDIDINSSNTAATRVTLRLTRYPFIQRI